MKYTCTNKLQEEMVVQGGRKDGKTEADCFKLQVVKKINGDTDARFTTTPLLSQTCSQLALQLPSSTHLQIILKKKHS